MSSFPFSAVSDIQDSTAKQQQKPTVAGKQVGGILFSSLRVDSRLLGLFSTPQCCLQCVPQISFISTNIPFVFGCSLNYISQNPISRHNEERKSLWPTEDCNPSAILEASG
jgi:hypothetical protein